MKTLNETYSRLSMRRRYEVWFLRLALADGSGAWWFRYLLMNPRRAGCVANPAGAPVQVWATWFPRAGKPESFTQGFPLAEFRLSVRGRNPLGLSFRKAVLWHEGVAYEFRDLGERRRDRHKMRWSFDCCASAELYLEVEVDGQGPSIHRLSYVKTNCAGTFEVANNSLARAVVRLRRPGHPAQDLVTECGAVLEMVGDLPGELETSTEPADWPG